VPVTEQEAHRHITWKRAGWGSLALLVAVGIICLLTWLLIWYGPDVIARHDIGNVTGPLRILRMQQARDAARGRLLTFGAGLFAAGALVFTAWNLTLYRRNLTLYRRTNEISEQGQVTDRYTEAIEQLGYDKLDVRIGGIYALERIARDSPRDHPTVIKVLTTFVREHSREEWHTTLPGFDAPMRATRPDVQAAITVIGRRERTQDRSQVDLVGVNLTGANIRDANLMGATLFEATLTHTVLLRAKLSRTVLARANLSSAILAQADLTRAMLADANLTAANLNLADLTDANLSGAVLNGANLTGAKLTDANLVNADLNGASLAQYDEVPAGWVRDPQSGVLSRADT
jgi:hypothetical protein